MVDRYEIVDNSNYFYCDCLLCRLDEIRYELLCNQLMIYTPYRFWDKLCILSEKLFRALISEFRYWGV